MNALIEKMKTLIEDHPTAVKALLTGAGVVIGTIVGTVIGVKSAQDIQMSIDDDTASAE